MNKHAERQASGFPGRVREWLRAPRHIAVVLMAVLILAGLYTAVPHRNTSPTMAVTTQSGEIASTGQSAVASGVMDAPASKSIASAKSGTATTPRKVVQEATLTMTSGQVKQDADKLASLAEAQGGFVESLQWTGDKTQSSAQITLRIPNERFSSFLDNAKSYGTVTNFTQTGRDVTQQYNGLQVQISELQSEADAYTRLFQKAQSMQDMLQIQQQITGVNSQIADLTGQLHDLNRLVDLASLTVTLKPATPVLATAPSQHVLDALQSSLRVLAQSAMALVMALAWLLPWGLPLGAGLVVYRWSRRFFHRHTP